MIVQEIMTRNPKYVDTKASVRDAINLMQEFDIRHLPVLEDGELVGIVSDRDIRGVVLSIGTTQDPNAKTVHNLDLLVSQIMQANPVTIEQDSEISEAIELIVENKIGALPVVDAHDNKLKGILSYIDILKAISEGEEGEVGISSIL